jgi:hypothetical protein
VKLFHTLLKGTALTAIVAGVFYFVSPWGQHHQLTGSWVPIDIIERLDDPIAVSGWEEDGLRLVDGRTVQLPGFTALPKTSSLLASTTKNGVEIDEQGRVFGIVEVWHWCGNDPVRDDFRRVDLAMLLAFAGEGTFDIPSKGELPDYASPPDLIGDGRIDPGSFRWYQVFAGIRESPY